MSGIALCPVWLHVFVVDHLIIVGELNVYFYRKSFPVSD